jgi:hypothetical protein
MRADRSRAWSCAMDFAIQFLDGSRAVVPECRIVAQDTARAIEPIQDVRWPAGASRLKILDENGIAVHWRIEPNEPSASQEGSLQNLPQVLREGRRNRPPHAAHRRAPRRHRHGALAIHQRLERAKTQASKLKSA